MSSVSPIKALVLCGGKGTRLRPVTNTLPKHLLPIAAQGLGGAEGALPLAVQGEEAQLARVVKVAEACTRGPSCQRYGSVPALTAPSPGAPSPSATSPGW